MVRIRTTQKAMRHISRAILMSAVLVLLGSTAGAQGAKPLTKCAPTRSCQERCAWTDTRQACGACLPRPR
jgi:hypothetical protein